MQCIGILKYAVYFKNPEKKDRLKVMFVPKCTNSQWSATEVNTGPTQ